MLTDTQKQTAQAIVNIFETGKVLGDYASVVSVAGDPGGLTYGRSQTTLMGGNLYLLIKDYCEAADAEFAEQFKPYLDQIFNKNTKLNRDSQLHNLLRDAGRNDPVMWRVQDTFFDRVYWNPALKNATTLGIKSALGSAVVYDSIVHGSWGKIRDRNINKFGQVSAISEKAWIKNYVSVRRDWLATHPTVPLLHRTVYRMDAFIKLVDANNWDLTLPLKVRTLVIDEEILAPHSSLSAQIETVRLLKLEQPFLEGEDVRRVQEALKNQGFELKVDDTYGPKTEAAVKQFQEKHGLKADGIVGPATLAELGI